MDIAVKEQFAAFLNAFYTEDTDIEDRRRIALFVCLSIIGIFFLILFSTTAIVQGNIALAASDMLTAIILTLNLLDARKRKQSHSNISIGIAFVALLFVYLYVSGGIGGTAFVWYYTFPLIACYLLGSRRGGIVSGLMLLPVLTMLFVNTNYPFFAKYSLSFVWRFAAAYTVVGVFSYLFENTREKNRQELNAVNQSLEKLVRERTSELTTANEQLIEEVEKRKQAHQSMQRSQDILMIVMNSIAANVYVADMDTHEILFMNKHMQKVFGRDMTGERCWQSIRNNPGPCSNCTNPQLIDRHKKPTGLHIWQGQNQITNKWYIHYDRATTWTDGRLVRIQIALDITEHRQTEEKLRQAQKMESIGTLAGGVAHDFNNLLAIIIGNMELALADIPKSNPAHANLKEIKTAGFRAKEIVQQLLSFSRRTNDAFKPISLTAVIEDAIRFLRSAIPSTVTISLAADRPDLMILSEPTQIHQIMMNLCTNASQAMHQTGGSISIDMKRVVLSGQASGGSAELPAGEYVRLHISDTGPGIAPDCLDHIFEPYFTTKAVGKGSGMGLAVVHGIVKKHQGDISVASTPGVGTTFTILLPLVENTSAPVAETLRTLPTGTEKILLIDDEALLLKMEQRTLSRLGYKVNAFQSPHDGLAAFVAQPEAFDLVITDMTMPKMTGIALCQSIKALRKDMPVIICSGYSDTVNSENAATMGFSAFLMKPVPLQELAQTIRTVLDRSDAMLKQSSASQN